MENMKQIFIWPINHSIVDKLLPTWLERGNTVEILRENHINRERFNLLYHSKLTPR